MMKPIEMPPKAAPSTTRIKKGTGPARGSAWARRAEARPARKAASVLGLPAEHRPASRRLELEALEDFSLLELVLEGDSQATQLFFGRFRGLILSCVVKVGARAGLYLNSDDIMDVLGDVFLNMISHDYRRLRLYRIDGGCTVATWIGVIASSTTRDYLRRARRHRLEPVTEAELDRFASPNSGPEEVLVDNERRSFVDQALGALSPRDREFAELYFAEACSPEAIAEKMSVSVSTVYSKKAKIKARLTRLAEALEPIR